MKKLLSLAALALMLCVAACQNGGYKITGTVNGSQDGDTVVLISKQNDTLQTAVIQVRHGRCAGQRTAVLPPLEI